MLKNYIEEHGTGGNWIALPHKIGSNYYHFYLSLIVSEEIINFQTC